MERYENIYCPRCDRHMLEFIRSDVMLEWHCSVCGITANTVANGRYIGFMTVLTTEEIRHLFEHEINKV